jgi:folate-dependent phosphoribosylglycinamide formyltransferase PurN
MKKISILTQDIDLGTLKFIRFCIKNNFEIKYLLVSPPVKKHPLRVKQDLIRKNVFIKNDENSYISWFKAILRNSKIFEISKKLVYFILVAYFKKRHHVQVEKLQDDLFSKKNNCFEYLTVMYSFEGILSANAIQRFRHGIVNIHPASLPDFRGLDGGLWALKEESKIGVSAYLVDRGIDTGPIINFYPLKDKGKDLPQYIQNLKELKRKSFIDAINRLFEEKFQTLNPTIKRSQNRGLMAEPIMKDLYKNFKN